MDVKTIIIQKLNSKVEFYHFLLKQTSAENVDQATLIDYNRQLKKWTPIINNFNLYQHNEKTLKELTETLNQETNLEFINLYKIEIETLTKQQDKLFHLLLRALAPESPDDSANVIIEIRPGTGGEEAKLFVGDLFRLYFNFAQRQNWKIETLVQEVNGLGGFEEIIFAVKGKNIFQLLKNESGVHRVQRIPVTENKGRVHTSTASVVVRPEPQDNFKLKINPSDLRIDTFRSSGAGGQHVNTTDSAVRITYLPENIVVSCQNGRSQHENKEQALRILTSKIYEVHQAKINAQINLLKKQAIGTGERSEKIRTYNFPQNRITDHRPNVSWNNLTQIMNGKLDDIINTVLEDQLIKTLMVNE